MKITMRIITTRIYIKRNASKIIILHNGGIYGVKYYKRSI